MNFGNLNLSTNGGPAAINLGPELLDNFSFDLGFASWTADGTGTAATAAAGACTFYGDPDPGSFQQIYQAGKMTIDTKTYRAQVEILTRTAGSCRIRLGATFSDDFSSLGIHTFTDIATLFGNFYIQSDDNRPLGAFAGTIGFCSLREVLP